MDRGGWGWRERHKCAGIEISRKKAGNHAWRYALTTAKKVGLLPTTYGHKLQPMTPLVYAHHVCHTKNQSHSQYCKRWSVLSIFRLAMLRSLPPALQHFCSCYDWLSQPTNSAQSPGRKSCANPKSKTEILLYSKFRNNSSIFKEKFGYLSIFSFWRKLATPVCGRFFFQMPF